MRATVANIPSGNRVRFPAWTLLALAPNFAIAATAPSAAEVEKLALVTTQTWIKGVRARDMTAFWNGTSKAYRNKYPLAAENKEWGFMFTDLIELPLPTTQRPALDKAPVVDKDGILVAHGTLALAPYELHFGYQWLNEGSKWLYVGSELDLRALKPSISQRYALASSVTDALVRTIKANDPKTLMGLILPPYRPANPDEVAANFLKTAAAQRVGVLPPSRKVVLSVAEIPQDDALILRLLGRIDGGSAPIFFSYRLFPARGGWQLAGFDFSSKSFLSE